MTSPGRVVAFMDLGTNSVRLLVVRINGNGTWTVLTQQKMMVRLGEGEFTQQHLQLEAMVRTAEAIRQLGELAHSFGAEEIHAVATAATREAENQGEFLELVRAASGINLHVIAGKEEARLIYLGVSRSVNIGKKAALFIDIGGGSTEIAIGDSQQFSYLDSLKLGAIRLTNTERSGFAGKVAPKRYARLQDEVRNIAVRSLQQLRQQAPKLVYGSSGTIENLATIAARMAGNTRQTPAPFMTLEQLRFVVTLLCSLPIAQRRMLPGLNPDRADIIIAGAAILETLMAELNLTEIHVSDRGLRDGLLVDYLERGEETSEMARLSLRARSVRQLGRLCNYDEVHAEQVARLAVSLFDSAKAAELHNLGTAEKELLGWAARLHDIGLFLNYANHHAHSYYFIRNAELLGFDQTEAAIMATAVLFHRKTLPRSKNPEYAVLDEASQRTVRLLCIFLRVAETLDRSHANLVQDVHLTPTNNRLALEIIHEQPCPLELQGVRVHGPALEKTFGRKVMFSDGEI
ncbi:MAG: Ppx/GppA phosphatase family protein [bacterium]